ncbi:MAG: DUF1592 domain-containing protein [Verrucomicrobiota bacterium]
MSRSPITYPTIAILALFAVPLAADESFGSLASFFSTHCTQCHGEAGKVKGKVDLLEISSPEKLRGDPELLASLVDVIDFEEMPPEDEPQPTATERSHILELLEMELATALKAESTFAQAPIRRMNRLQYNNAVVDLLKLSGNVYSLPEKMMRSHSNYFDPASGVMPETVRVGSRPLGKSQMIEPRLAGVAPFPQDLRAEHGFDNRGDHLSLSPLLMESFLRLGQSIVSSHDFGPKRVGIWKPFFGEFSKSEQADLRGSIEKRLLPFLTHAFRRPVPASTLERYVDLVESRVASGATVSAAMKLAASAAISSPQFLYLYDEALDQTDSPDVESYDLASRLSFFLWGSIPDQHLLDLAGTGELNHPSVLEDEIDRMLNDPRAKRFCDSFPSQWLQLERIISSVPDPDHFADFYFSKYRDSMHMMLEPLLLFEAVLIEDRPITDLIDPDFTYLSATLRESYGDANLPGVDGKKNIPVVLDFHRVPITDRRYGGVITNAAVMTMTSGPERSQPITRGAWLLTTIFNDPPEPPPADVPALGEVPTAEEAHLTLRERLTNHRERADCAGCHEQIDPLGFALENFDPVGKWRDIYENGRKVVSHQ